MKGIVREKWGYSAPEIYAWEFAVERGFQITGGFSVEGAYDDDFVDAE